MNPIYFKDFDCKWIKIRIDQSYFYETQMNDWVEFILFQLIEDSIIF